MNQEQVIELARKAGISHSCDHYQPDWKCETQDLVDFVTLVEQATLERAEFECLKLAEEMIQDDHREGCLDCKQAIRNLAKEPQ